MHRSAGSAAPQLMLLHCNNATERLQNCFCSWDIWKFLLEGIGTKWCPSRKSSQELPRSNIKPQRHLQSRCAAPHLILRSPKCILWYGVRTHSCYLSMDGGSKSTWLTFVKFRVATPSQLPAWEEEASTCCNLFCPLSLQTVTFICLLPRHWWRRDPLALRRWRLHEARCHSSTRSGTSWLVLAGCSWRCCLQLSRKQVGREKVLRVDEWW